MTAPAAKWITIDGRRAVFRGARLRPFPDGFRLPDGIRFKEPVWRGNAMDDGCIRSWAINDGKLYLTHLHCEVIVDHILRRFYFEMEDVWGSRERVLAEWMDGPVPDLNRRAHLLQRVRGCRLRDLRRSRHREGDRGGALHRH